MQACMTGAVLSRRHAIPFAETAAEMRRAVESPAEGDLADRAPAPARISELSGRLLQTPAQNIRRHRLAGTGEDHAQIARRHSERTGDAARAQFRIAQVLFDEESGFCMCCGYH